MEDDVKPEYPLTTAVWLGILIFFNGNKIYIDRLFHEKTTQFQDMFYS